MITHSINKVKQAATEHPLVNQVCFGPIEEYDHKATIKYPYVNVDIVSCALYNAAQTHKFRVYVMDRNKIEEAYNKTELIITDMMILLDVNSYTINYFNYNFKDMVNGVYADIEIEGVVSTDCTSDAYADIYGAEGFILTENGDLIRQG